VRFRATECSRGSVRICDPTEISRQLGASGIIVRSPLRKGHGRFDCFPHERADFGRQLRSDQQGSILVVTEIQVAMVMLLIGALSVLELLDPEVLAHDLRDVRGGTMLGDAQQRVFVLRARDPRHRTHLRVRDHAAPERVADLRKAFERASHAHLLARRDGVDAALPAEPLRAARDTVALVALPAIELGDELEEAIGCRAHVAPELEELGFEALQFSVGGRCAPNGREADARRGVHRRILHSY
jgi:hypothetical protein